ncbi:MAG: TIGR00266 family protein [Oscillospiraceae bacterium]|nr:TIGR00266 family protein [Oscillospiraceae bacterium]
MKYQIIGQTVPAVEVTMDAGESVYTQSGGMIWHTPGITMSTNAKGGLMKSIGRMFAGESLFMTTYTAQVSNASVTFGSTVPGTVIPINVGGVPLICQKGAFLCAQQSVGLDVVFTKKFTAGLLGGEGFILQKLSGSGMAFLEVDGDMVSYDLPAGGQIFVDTGNVVAFEESVAYEITTVKGLSNVFFGGEGLFLTKLTGPGKIYLQTQNFNDFAGRIIARIPSK